MEYFCYKTTNLINGKPKNQARKDQIRDTLTGYKHTDEARSNMSDALRGNQNAKGNTFAHTDEAKEKISLAKRGVAKTEEHKQKLSLSRKGKCTGKDNPMANAKSRNKVSQSKIGRRLLTNGSVRRLAVPGSDLWESLTAAGFSS